MIRDLLTLVSANTLSQLLNFVVSPVISRLYSPESFGIFGIFMGYYNIISEISTLRYHLSIPLNNDVKDSFYSFWVSVLNTTIIGVIGPIIVAIMFISSNKSFYKSYFFIFMMAAIILKGIFQTYYYLYIKLRKFKIISLSKILLAIGVTSIQIMLFKLKWVGLISGILSGYFISVFYLQKKLEYTPIKFLKFKELKSKYVRFKNFALFDTWGALLNIIGIQIPVLTFQSIYGVESVGYYYFAQRIMLKPLGIIGSSIAEVMYPIYIQHKDKKDVIFTLIKKFHLSLVFLSALPFIVFFHWAPVLFKLIFGSQWYQAGVVSKYMSIWFFSVFVISPFSNIISAYEKQYFNLIFQILLAGTRIFIVLLIAPHISFVQSVSLISLGSMILWWFYFIVILFVIKADFKDILNVFLLDILIISGFVVSFKTCVWFFDRDTWWLGLILFLATIFFYLTVIKKYILRVLKNV